MRGFSQRIEKMEALVERDADDEFNSAQRARMDFEKSIEAKPLWAREFLCFFDFITSQAEEVYGKRHGTHASLKEQGESFRQRYLFLGQRCALELDQEDPPADAIDRAMVQKLFLRVANAASDLDPQTRDDFLKIIANPLRVSEISKRLEWKLPLLGETNDPYWKFIQGQWEYCKPPRYGGSQRISPE